MPVRILAVIPAFQACRTVGTVVRGLIEQWNDGWQPDPAARGSIEGSPVIVVDDGSTDGTAEVARRAGARVTRHERNRGKGAALRTGLVEAAKIGATHVVTVDADGQHPPSEARRLRDHPAPPEALVLGIRNLTRDGAPRESQVSNQISNFFLSWFSGRRLRDTQCGLRRYPVAQTLKLGALDDGYAFEAEIILRAARAGLMLAQVPVRVYYPPRDERVTHFHVVKDPAKIVRRVVLTLGSPKSLPSRSSP